LGGDGRPPAWRDVPAGVQQGDPGMGDIRIGGFDFGSSVIATADIPPPQNNFSVAGDITLNTGQWFVQGGAPGGYDLWTVMSHEFGHALGLEHSSISAAQEYAFYTGIKWGLHSDDIAGIRNVYSANQTRSKDGWDAWQDNGTFATAMDFTGFIQSDLTFMAGPGQDLTTWTDVDFYKFTVPSGFSGTLTARIQSTGISQLSPTLTIYNASQQQLGTISGYHGATLDLSVTGLTVGQPVYIKVSAAEASEFGIGWYGMAAKFGTAALPTIPLVNTQLLNGNPPSYLPALPEESGHDEHGHDGFRAADTFTVTSDAAPPSVDGTTQFLAAASRALVPLLNPNPLGVSTVLLAHASAATKPEALVVAPQADFLRRPTGYAETLYSGTGSADPALAPMEEDAEETIPGVEPPAPGPVEKPMPAADMIEEMPATGALWRWASETCFANTAWRAGPSEASEPMPMALAEETQDLGGLLTAAAVVVGGAWGAQPDERRRSRRPRM
ncbi:MAG: matrixin family metalloprotease, partial [Gemmataceae bacterium]|nr:matrixin family metalloprotease [Gemmataceae bacterium]